MIAVPAATRSGTIAAAAPCGQGQEDRVRGRQLGVDGQARRPEMRMDPGDRVVVATAAGQPDQVDVRVAGEQPDQLGADVARWRR